jgi:hypothetical protein
MSDALKRIADLARLMVDAEKRVKDVDAELKTAKADLLRIQTEDLPELMSELGMTSIKLEDGSSIEVVQDVMCAISEERRPAAHAWLVGNGFGGLIKTGLNIAFERGEYDAAVAAAEELRVQFPGREVEARDAVHPATLKSFVKEQMEKGIAIPFDLFGIHPFNKAKYKAGKK